MKAERDERLIPDPVVDLRADREDLERLRMEFLTTVAHELRSPTTVVAGIAHLLKWRHADIDEGNRDRLLATLERESGRLLGLVQEFLDLEAIERGDFHLDRKPVDLIDLACEAMIDAGQADRTRVVTGRSDCTALVDRGRIKKVLMNLLSNAARSSTPAGRITLEVACRNGTVDVSVTDGGPSPSSGDRALLLDQAGRVAPVGEPKPGAGTGLYVSRLIAQMHGGELGAEEPPDGGARFTLSVPAEELPGDALQSSREGKRSRPVSRIL